MKSQIKILMIFMLLSAIMLMVTCRKDPDSPDSNKFEFGQIQVDSIGYFSLTITSHINSLGENNVIQYGHCWDTLPQPDISDSMISQTGNPNGLEITSTITPLHPLTTYYIRAYCKLANTTVYSDEVEATTLKTGRPVLATSEVIDLTWVSATCGGNVMNDSGLVVTVRGCCWGSEPDPTLANCIGFTQDSMGVGSFTSQITGLSPLATYYVRAYATNAAATVYGNERSFTTPQGVVLPTVTTNNVTEITQTTATCGGDVVYDGGATVTAKGICWSTSTNPTLSDSFTTDGNGTGTFISYLTGLTPDTSYYVRAYATNSEGTAYGNEQIFPTANYNNPCPGIPTVTYEGQVYNTVLIGDQCWFKENLNVGVRINGSLDQSNNQIIEKYCYNDDEANCDVYGGEYRWSEAMQYVTTEGTQGICPAGWHIPTDAEWTALTDFLGGEDVAGGALKEAGTEHWIFPNTEATNLSGFTALPAGYRSAAGGFHELGKYITLWSSSPWSYLSWTRVLYFDSDNVGRVAGYDLDGHIVRCLKDE